MTKSLAQQSEARPQPTLVSKIWGNDWNLFIYIESKSKSVGIGSDFLSFVDRKSLELPNHSLNSVL